MFLTTKELAKKWGVDQSRVLKLAREGRIEGAQQFGNSWMFPQDTKKPADARRKEIEKKKETFFRFPLYINFPEEYYNPPLTNEEKLLRNAQIAFYACEVEKAEKILLSLFEKTENIYIKISCVYLLCYIAIYNNKNYEYYVTMLDKLLSLDFPFKNEMMALKYALDSDLGYYKSTLEQLYITPNYVYHPDAFYIMSLVSFITIENGDFSLISKLRYETQELLCQQMEHDGHYWEAQRMHYLLLIAYQVMGNQEMMLLHAKRALSIAFEYNLIWQSAYNAFYYPEVTRIALEDYPKDFIKSFTAISKKMHERFSAFEKAQENPSYLGVLSEKEFELAFLANQGYTNREIANKIGISEKVISKRYNEIYDKLGVKNKQELIEVINQTHKNDKL